jgi:hypothetical protein
MTQGNSKTHDDAQIRMLIDEVRDLIGAAGEGNPYS